jgi:hypothetical protein
MAMADERRTFQKGHSYTSSIIKETVEASFEGELYLALSKLL